MTCWNQVPGLKSGVLSRQNKLYCFIFEALGSFGCGFYANYIFFLLRDNYNFGNAGNLGVSALQGLVWAVASWRGGLFAQRVGYFTSMKAGLLGMMMVLAVGIWARSLVIQLAILVLWTTSSCFVWPALEALVSDGESDRRLPRQLGIYNVTWATCSAFSYFFGGTLFQYLGSRSMFWLPILFCLVQFGLLVWLSRKDPVRVKLVAPVVPHPHPPEPRSPPRTSATGRSPTAGTARSTRSCERSSPDRRAPARRHRPGHAPAARRH